MLHECKVVPNFISYHVCGRFVGLNGSKLVCEMNTCVEPLFSQLGSHLVLQPYMRVHLHMCLVHIKFCTCDVESLYVTL